MSDFGLRQDLDFNRIKVGVKMLDDAVLNLGSYRYCLHNHDYVNKSTVYRAIMDNDVEALRNISNFFYNLSGIYKKACEYIAFMYRYDWYVVPEIYDESVKQEKVLKDFTRILNFLDESDIKQTCGQIALEVVKSGCFYGYIVPCATRLVIQQLPARYCRVRYNVGNHPAVEFNMRFFDTFRDPAYRMKVLDLFPAEFKKGYYLYKKGKLATDDITWHDHPAHRHYEECYSTGWYLLDPQSTVKFNINGSDSPALANAIPVILDLDAAQDLDRRKQMQKLLKIVVQKLPRDKNGDLIFDVDEATDLHNNVVQMLRRAVGVDVLTTFADVDSIDMSDKNTSTSTDDLEKVERAVYNALGFSKNIFNADGNLALTTSILNDESSYRNLLLQFADFYDRVTQALNTAKKKYNFKFYMLETTQYNYKELSKMYKEHTQLGFSKMLPQVALGQSQSFILNTAKFENEVLDLNSIMVPPLMSSVMSSQDVLGNRSQSNGSNTQNKTGQNTGNEKSSAGRPEKEDTQKSEKTIQNKESMN